jgi:sugar lactone lactonase YvrE
MLKRIFTFLVTAVLCRTASGQIFVSELSGGVVGEFSTSGQMLNPAFVGVAGPTGMACDGQGNLFIAGAGGVVMEVRTSGAVVNPVLITGLVSPVGIALDGSGHIFISEQNNTSTPPAHGGTIAEYTTSGQVVNASFIVGDLFSAYYGLACDNQGHLFVVNQNSSGHRIDLFTTSGMLIQAGLISGPDVVGPNGVALDGHGNLYVANLGLGTVGEYTTSGQAINPALITGLNQPSGIALDGMGHLFVSNLGSGTIGEYTTSGAVINASLVSGLNSPFMGLLVIPEPSPAALAVVILALFVPLSIKRRIQF